MVALIIAILLLELFGAFSEINPLLLVGALVVGLAVLGLMYLGSNGMPTSSFFYFLMSFMCLVGCFLFFKLLL